MRERRSPAHLALTPRHTLALTVVTWAGALTLLAVHLAGRLPLGLTGTDLWCCWLLALGCTGFWTTFLRVTSPLIAEDWQVGRLIGDLTRLPADDPGLDEMLARDPEGGFVRPSLWPVFGWIGGLFWGAAALYTALAAAGRLQPRPSDMMLTLISIMIPAVQCTAAAVNGPPLTRQRAVRHAAALAHYQLRHRGAEAEAVAVITRLAASDPQRAEALLRDVAEQARARAAQPGAPAELRVVNGDARSERERHY